MPRNSKHIKGDQAELIAQEYFIKKGYSVFKNISAQGLDKMPNKQKHKNNIVDIREWKK